MKHTTKNYLSLDEWSLDIMYDNLNMMQIVLPVQLCFCGNLAY